MHQNAHTMLISALLQTVKMGSSLDVHPWGEHPDYGKHCSHQRDEGGSILQTGGSPIELGTDTLQASRSLQDSGTH